MPTIDGLTVVGFNPIMLKGDKGDPGGGLPGVTVTGAPDVGLVLTATSTSAATWSAPTSTGNVIADGGTASSVATVIYDGGHA